MNIPCRWCVCWSSGTMLIPNPFYSSASWRSTDSSVIANRRNSAPTTRLKSDGRFSNSSVCADGHAKKLQLDSLFIPTRFGTGNGRCGTSSKQISWSAHHHGTNSTKGSAGSSMRSVSSAPSATLAHAPSLATSCGPGSRSARHQCGESLRNHLPAHPPKRDNCRIQGAKIHKAISFIQSVLTMSGTWT